MGNEGGCKPYMHGIGAEWQVPMPKASKEQNRNAEQAMRLIKDYLDNAVVSCLQSNCVVPYLVPWFVIQKEELGGQKLSFNSRLSKHKRRFSTKTISNGRVEGNFSRNETRPLGNQN